MTWSLFYLCCFCVGLALCFLSALTGGGHGPVHLHGHVRLHLPGMRTVASHQHPTSTSAVNGFTSTAFLCWFGGAGYLLQRHPGMYAWGTLLLAMLSGVVGANLIFWFLSKFLLPHERALTAEDTAITGVIGRVSGPLGNGRTGEILYSQLGVCRSSPARSADGTSIGRDAEVIVLRYEQGIAYVQPWNEFEL